MVKKSPIHAVKSDENEDTIVPISVGNPGGAPAEEIQQEPTETAILSRDRSGA